jgi:transcriptional regulator with XRE-family HTH domain
MNIKQIVGENIRFIRQKKEITLDELAGLTGMSRTFLSDIERYIKTPSITSLEKIAKALKVDPSILLTKDAYKSLDKTKK